MSPSSVLAVALACFFAFRSYLSLGTRRCFVMVLLVLSYEPVARFAGVLTFGHALYFGIGAFVAGWLRWRAGPSRSAPR